MRSKANAVATRVRSARHGRPARPDIWRALVSLGLAVIVSLGLGASPAHAGGNGQDPYASGCASNKWKVWPKSGEATRDGGLIIRDKTGVYAGTVYVYHSGTCQTAWAEWYTNTAFHWFHGELSLWNAWNQNQKSWTSAGTTWSRTKMIDDQVGVTSCVGMQVYYNGEWRRWQMGFCW